MLIKAFGTFWNPDIVEWGSVGAGNKGSLKGTIKRNNKSYLINFWDAKGIYVLHADFRAIYVGKAFSTPIGKRLRDHLTDRFAGRWDMFSWYSVSSPRTTQLDVSQPGQRQLKPETVVNTLEALGILIADPSLNRKRESLKNADEATQPENSSPQTIRHYLEKIYSKVDNIDSKT